MSNENESDLMLLYVAGVADEGETARAEALISGGSPQAAAEYAEAFALFNAVPLALSSVRPPDAVRQAVLGRIAADHSASRLSMSSMSIPSSSAAVAPGLATRYRWPIYAASGIAACLAVALTLGARNYSRLSARNQQMATTLADSEAVMRSPYVSLASLSTLDKADNKSYGRVLYCPVTRRYQVTVFGLSPLPADKAYELWLINKEGQKVPAGTFAMDNNGAATVMAQPSLSIQDATTAAITVEPAAGSAAPTGSIQLVGQLQAAH